MKSIKISINEMQWEAELLDTPTAQAIFEALPFEGMANVWGEEIYFDIPVSMGQEPEAREEVEVGDLAFWPVGSAFCIFFGRTPVSTGEKPRAYSPVNVFGKVKEASESFKQVSQNSLVRVEEA